uniref:BPTI/Kunitz inhibitor domain-containing protein n=1 Tax=Moschus moschiferus TaxID=68415 RepID=A0A8C6D1W3_MOSMO
MLVWSSDDRPHDGAIAPLLPGASKPDFCMEPILTGVCKAVMVRYFYNASAGLCDQFIYGICGGNKNNFPSEKECMETCNPKA